MHRLMGSGLGQWDEEETGRMYDQLRIDAKRGQHAKGNFLRQQLEFFVDSLRRSQGVVNGVLEYPKGKARNALGGAALLANFR